MTQYLNRKPKALSGGQRQRVAVGRAIVRNPKVFLFDEPLSNLDAKLRVTMRSELASLHQRLQATMIYVTHDQIEAMTLGTKIVVMKDGFIQQIGAPLYLYNSPINKFVAGYFRAIITQETGLASGLPAGSRSRRRLANPPRPRPEWRTRAKAGTTPLPARNACREIGRASCRERV